MRKPKKERKMQLITTTSGNFTDNKLLQFVNSTHFTQHCTSKALLYGIFLCTVNLKRRTPKSPCCIYHPLTHLVCWSVCWWSCVTNLCSRCFCSSPREAQRWKRRRDRGKPRPVWRCSRHWSIKPQPECQSLFLKWMDIDFYVKYLSRIYWPDQKHTIWRSLRTTVCLHNSK